MSSPKSLLDKLKSKTKNSQSIKFQVFRGIKNDDGISIDHHYCYAISFLQLFFHCPNVINYFKTLKTKNPSERLLLFIFKSLYRKNNYSSINIFNFIINWRGWEGRCLPNENRDVAEFIVYLLDSVTTKLSDLFLIQGEYYDNSIAPLERNYFLTLEINGNSLNDALNIGLTKCKNFTHLPEYLMLYLIRNVDMELNDKYLPINTFLKIDNIVYRHLATIVFGGDVSSGHYTSYIKIDDEYFLFNDENVSPLFYYERCPRDLRSFITECNNQINRKGTIFLYCKSNDKYMKNIYECISFLSPFLSLPGSSPITAMKNTLMQLNKKKNKKNKSIKKNVPSSSLLTISSSSSSRSSSSESSGSSLGSTSMGSSSALLTQSFSTPSTPLSHHHMHPNHTNQILSVSNQNSISSEPRPVQNMQQLTTTNSSMTQLSPIHSDQNIHQMDDYQPSFFIRRSPSGDLIQKNVAQYKHLNLKRDVINIQSMKFTNLCGKMNISISGIPSKQDERKLPSRYAKLRFLFKYAGKILRNLQYNDQGKINSDILESHYEKEEDPEREEIEEQGNIVYDALNNLKDEEFSEELVEQSLSPIIEWYLINYGDKEVKDLNHNTIINDDLKSNLFDPVVPRSEGLTEEELNAYVDNILGNFKEEEEEEEEFIEDEADEGFTDILDFSIGFNEINDENMREKINEYNDDFNDLFKYYYKGDHPKNCKHKILINPTLEDVINYDPNEDLFSNDPFIDALNDDIEFSGTYDYKIKKPKKRMLDKIAHKLEKSEKYYFAGALEWLGKEKNYKQVYDDGTDDTALDDDNNFSISFYDWQKRAEIIDVDTIYESIIKAEAIANKKKQKKKKNDDVKMSNLALEVYQDLIRMYCSNSAYKWNRQLFIDDYNVKNSNPLTMPACVRAYRQIKKIPNDQPIFTENYISKRIAKFEKKDETAKEVFLNQNLGIWGGSRQNLQKVSDKTLLCLITLLLDFPTLSTNSYVTYINSKYGPNYENNITLRTVQRYLNILGFKVKRASFAPPNRNSVGLRIFRVAWCRMIEDILTNENILLGFIDEAAITTCEGKNHGRAFNGITPLANCTLSKIKMTVIALIFPGFGVLYKIIEKSANGDQYAQFLKEAIEFTRRYICNKETEIVIIEDNCPIHSTEKVEKAVDDLHIALLPIVQYSAALNGVAEEYFEIVKTHIFMDSTTQGDNALKDSIEEQWKYSTFQYYNDIKGIQSFREWRTRMQQCKKGIPLFSEHVSISEEYNDEIENQLKVSVDRVMNHVEKIILT